MEISINMISQFIYILVFVNIMEALESLENLKLHVKLRAKMLYFDKNPQIWYIMSVSTLIFCKSNLRAECSLIGKEIDCRRLIGRKRNLAEHLIFVPSAFIFSSKIFLLYQSLWNLFKMQFNKKSCNPCLVIPTLSFTITVSAIRFWSCQKMRLKCQKTF